MKWDQASALLQDTFDLGVKQFNNLLGTGGKVLLAAEEDARKAYIEARNTMQELHVALARKTITPERFIVDEPRIAETLKAQLATIGNARLREMGNAVLNGILMVVKTITGALKLTLEK